MQDALQRYNSERQERDVWGKLHNSWIRHQVQDVTSFFMPDRTSGGPRPENLQGGRITKIHPSEARHARFIPETWENADFSGPTNIRQDAGFQWTDSTSSQGEGQYDGDLLGLAVLDRGLHVTLRS